jgi:hypothetical protein
VYLRVTCRRQRGADLGFAQFRRHTFRVNATAACTDPHIAALAVAAGGFGLPQSVFEFQLVQLGVTLLAQQGFYLRLGQCRATLCRCDACAWALPTASASDIASSGRDRILLVSFMTFSV